MLLSVLSTGIVIPHASDIMVFGIVFTDGKFRVLNYTMVSSGCYLYHWAHVSFHQCWVYIFSAWLAATQERLSLENM